MCLLNYRLYIFTIKKLINSLKIYKLYLIYMDPTFESTSDLKKIFDSFDLDKSGTIDLKQLGNVAEKLGKPLAAEQLAQIMKKLDVNKDGKISYGEFEYWWTKGMQGKMAQLVYLKAKAMKMTNFVKNKFKNASINLDGHKGNPKPDIYNIKVNFGVPVADAIKIDFGFYVSSTKQIQLRERIKSYVPDLKPNAFGLVIKLPSKNPAQAKVALDYLLNSIINREILPMPIKSVEQNSFVQIKSIVKDKQLIVKLCLQPELENIVEPVSTKTEGIIKKIGEGFYSNVDLNLSLNSTIQKILAQPLINNILRGFNLNFCVQANNSALGKLRKLAQKQQWGLPSFINLITLFRCAKLNLKIKTPQNLNAFFKKLGILQVLNAIPSLNDLLQEFSPSILDALASDVLIGLIYQFSKYAFKHVENDVQIFILGGALGTGSLRLQGKNMSKIHSILFNEL